MEQLRLTERICQYRKMAVVTLSGLGIMVVVLGFG